MGLSQEEIAAAMGVTRQACREHAEPVSAAKGGDWASSGADRVARLTPLSTSFTPELRRTQKRSGVRQLGHLPCRGVERVANYIGAIKVAVLLQP